MEDYRIAELFTAHGVTGCFVFFDPQKSVYTLHNPARAAARFLPASTFKILNSLVALEECAVSDVDTVVPWNGTDYGRDVLNKDHTMRSAIACSAIWVYQELARRVGPARMEYWVKNVGYGNADISGAFQSFWLDGGLRISAMEQVAFLRRLQDDALPFSRTTMQGVRDIRVTEKTDSCTLYVKSGWAQRCTPQIGWQVGWVQHGNDVYYFALNIDIVESNGAKARDALMREGLGLLGAL